jgi:hypothetical protein
MPNDILTGGGFPAADTLPQGEVTMSRKRKGPVMGYKADGSVGVFDEDHPDFDSFGENGLPPGWSDHPGDIQDEKLRTSESLTARAVRNPTDVRPAMTAEQAPPASQSALKRYPNEAEPGASPTMPITDAAVEPDEPRRRPGRPRKQPQDGDPLPVELRGGHERADWHDQDHPGGDPSLDKPPST